MSWLGRRAATGSDETATMTFAGTFAAAVDRTFPNDDAAIDRVRDKVLAAFIEDAPTVATRRSAPPRPSVLPRLSIPPRLHRPARRWLTIALAASLMLTAFGSVAVQAQPGGPFYPLKLAIETATLPAIEAPAGWEARLERLQRRIDECLVAQQSGNEEAVTSGLGEYRSELSGLDDALVDPARRSSLIAVVSDDLPIVVGLEAAYPSETARLLIADMRAIVGSVDPKGSDPKPVSRPIRDRPDDAADNPNPGRGNPHTGGTTGDPHADGATGDPHTDGAKGDKHPDGSTGNPHVDGQTGNPHRDGEKGNPHAGASTEDPRGGGDGGKPNGSRKTDAKEHKDKKRD
jgi:hypothetical protein